MKRIAFIPLIFIALLSIPQCSGTTATATGGKENPDDGEIKTYRNPVGSLSLPDPTVIKVGEKFWLYATEDTRNVPIMQSDDLTRWLYAGTAFTDQTRPSFVENGAIWAPDINRIDGKYVLYYSMSVWGGEWTCGIGVATADKPEGPFTGASKLFISSEIGVQNSIDPFYMEGEDGRKYLFWGSFRGIYAIELAEDGLSLKPGAEKSQVAGTDYEGIYIYPKNGYYYMFGSIGSCCNGASSTYTTVVGRSENLFGPYVNKAGERMLDNKHEVVVQGDSHFAGTGHNAEIITDNAGTDWLLYHAYEKSNPAGRKLMLDAIVWEDGWPCVKNLVPARSAPAPVF